MTDKITGYLEVGRDENGDIVINHPNLRPDVQGRGYIVLSPNQARRLAALLVRHADEAERERQGLLSDSGHGRQCSKGNLDATTLYIQPSPGFYDEEVQ